MANNIQQQVNALESKGLPALQQMQKLDPKMLVGVAIDNLEQGLKEDQRAKQVGGGNVGPSVIDKKLMGLGGLGLGQQEALTAARPGTQMQGKQMQASQLAQAMQQAQKRPAGGIASMPMMRNQMQRMADGGVVGLRGGGLPAIGANVKGPIPNMTPEQLEYVRKMGEFRKSINNPANTPEQKQRALQELQNYQREVPVGIQEAVDVMMRGPAKMPKMQAGGEVQKFQSGGEIVGYDGMGNPLTQEQFDALMTAQQVSRDTSIKIGDDTMVDASRLPRDPNRLTPAQQSERDLATIERRRADLERPSEEPSILKSITAGIAAGLPALREDISEFVEGARRAPAAMQRTIADTPMGQDMLREQERSAERRQNRREREQLDNMYATQNTLARSQLTDEQRLKEILQKGKLVAPSTMAEEEVEKSRAGLQPEKTPMSGKIFSLLQTLGDFSGAPKGYEGATFLARRRARDEAETDRQAKADLLNRELEGRFDLMAEQERLRSMAARGVAFADYASELDDYTLSLSPEYITKQKELDEKYGGGIFNRYTQEEKNMAEQELQQLLGQIRQSKLEEYRSLLDAFGGGSGTTAQTEPEFDYSTYAPNAGQ